MIANHIYCVNEAGKDMFENLVTWGSRWNWNKSDLIIDDVFFYLKQEDTTPKSLTSKSQNWL